MSHLREFEQLKITLEAIKSATNNFAAENCIGGGGFGKVYKGEIVHSEGQSMVAFKRLNPAYGQGNIEFWKEIIMLHLYKHDNLVRLLGFCDENDEKILVYEYVANKSLDLHLNSNDLTWTQRLKICKGVACGLAYLHSSVGTKVRVLHRDVKSSNILLDENWNAKISDFGLSKFANTNKFTFHYTAGVGTIGYCDPLYVETGLLTKESDVYSLGVVLFEVLCGRLCISNKGDHPLTGLARECYELNKLDTIIFGNIRDEIDPCTLRDFTTIAYRCLKRDREERPSITDVVRMLEYALTYQQSSGDEAIVPDIVDSVHLKALCLPDHLVGTGKVMQLIYTNSGLSLLALASNAIHKLWKWQRSAHNPSGKSTASIVPQLWRPTNRDPMSNDVDESKPAEESPACIVLSKNDSYLISASGGKVSLFNMMTFKVVTTFMPPPPAATYLAVHPQDNNIIAIGMEDSTIHIYNGTVNKVQVKLKGHQKQITGLAFSTLNALVSSGADAQLCIWNTIGWEKSKSRSIQLPPGHPYSLVGETKVQFHNDQRHLLVVHKSQIAIYDHQLECLKMWSPRESLSAAISSAIFSCDGLLLFTGFTDGAVGVFDADTLRLRCRIPPSAYISSSISSNSTAYPAVIASHPSDPNQFALGMSDGSVHVIEPADADPKWGGSASQVSNLWTSIADHHFPPSQKFQFGVARMGYNYVSELKPKDKDKTIQVKVYRTWTIRYPPNPAPKGFCSILLDKAGNAIQANMDVNDIDHFKAIIKENHAYNISNFICEETKTWQPTLPNATTLKFRKATTFQSIPADDFPLHYFNFVSYNQLYSRLPKSSILTDYIGCIQTVGDIARSSDPNKNQVDTRIIDIANLNGNVVQLTLWDTMATNFDKEKFISMPKPVMIAVTSCRVQEFRTQLQLSGTQATYYYLNPNIEEVNQSLPKYRAKFEANPPLEIVKQKYSDIKKEKTRNRFSLSRLVTQNPETYKSTRFTCEGSIVQLNTSQNWFHYTCTDCNRKLTTYTPPFECEKHGAQANSNIRYCFKATVADNSTTSQFLFFSPNADDVTNIECWKLVKEQGYTNPHQLPPPIEAIKGKTHVFQFHFNPSSKKESVEFIFDTLLDNKASKNTGDNEETKTKKQKTTLINDN